MFVANKSRPGSVEDSLIRLTNKTNYYIVEFILAFVSNETVGVAFYQCTQPFWARATPQKKIKFAALSGKSIANCFTIY